MDQQPETAPPPAADQAATAGTQPAPAGNTPAAPAANRLTATVGLCGAVVVLVLSLSAFVVGSHDGRPSGPGVGQYASDFSLRDAADERVTLRQFEGKPLVLLFTTADARDLRPHLAAASSALAAGGGDLQVLAVHPDAAAPGPVGDVRQCVRDLGRLLSRPVVSLLDAENAVADRYDVTRRPEAVVISPEGMILDRGPLAEALARLPRTLAVDRSGGPRSTSLAAATP